MSVLVGYMRVSKSDGSQTLDLQRDALLQAGVVEERIYQDLASGRKDLRPGLEECLKALLILPYFPGHNPLKLKQHIEPQQGLCSQ